MRSPKEKKSSIAKKYFLVWTKSIWQMMPVRARAVRHPAPFPEELPRCLIHLFSFPEDLVLDPFIGSGTTALAAV